ncbi:DNA methyltransferase family protein [Paenibacillus sonchi]|uniref:SAM-dependent DNA methyltransferase n=1 Tax=Paenibacillus sonchi TaxID=373687 RepID=UPI001E2CC940|nr:SAM-dependent DNA methyltransferase [Paenibacillus sonchi]MCE3203408.1 SAM-dependent DNA methyltransferase [Paenibacillus sonchi]
MKQETDRVKLYRVERFTGEQLAGLPDSLCRYAQAIGGLPKHHYEVFEKRGWLLPFLFTYDDLLWGRWTYWSDILLKGTIAGSGPIPQIQWTDTWSHPAQSTKKMLSLCLKHHEANIENFADWLLWGLAASEEALQISEQLNEYYYRTFDLFLLLDNPTDYLSGILCEQTGKGYKAGLGYYPTPFHLTCMMVEMVSEGVPEEMKRQTVNDPCVGCGAMMLPASNYYLRGSAMDISSIAIKLCKIQMYFYAPWFAIPGQVKGFDEQEPIPLIVNSDSGIGQLAFNFKM